MPLSIYLLFRARNATWRACKPWVQLFLRQYPVCEDGYGYLYVNTPYVRTHVGNVPRAAFEFCGEPKRRWQQKWKREGIISQQSATMVRPHPKYCDDNSHQPPPEVANEDGNEGYKSSSESSDDSEERRKEAERRGKFRQQQPETSKTASLTHCCCIWCYPQQERKQRKQQKQRK
jgi:hypothetical protein